MARSWAALAGLFVIAGCGSVPASSTLPLPSPPTRALEPWASFPANANPRPLIVFGDSVEVVARGFPDSARKIEWGCNKFTFARGVALSTAAAPGEVSGAQAYRELMAERAAAASPPAGCATARPFVITAVRHTSARFPTDRGNSELPAWVFDVPEPEAQLGYLALVKANLWGGRLTLEGRGAVVGADGRTLKIGVFNPGTGPCESGRYTASVAESSTAVAVALLHIPNPSPKEPVACELVARVGDITVELSAPLGGRVLVDEAGHAGEACASAPRRGDATATC